MTDQKLFKCFDARFLVMSVVAALLVIAAAAVEARFARGSAVRVAMALVQSVAIGWVIVRSVVLIRRLDELQYRIHLEALAGAFAATGVLISTWGFLEKAGLPGLEWGVWGWPIMVLLWGGGLVGLRRRYQ
jgi:hypothetical protein